MNSDDIQDQPAPDGWADAYRETMESVWQGVLSKKPTIAHSPADVAALVAFAAEIRAGIAAGLLAATPVVRVPLISVPMRDDQPRGHGVPRTDPDTGRTGPRA